MLHMFYNHFINYPTPSLLTYFWSFGFMAAMLFGVQLISGMFLAMFYMGDISLAFNSVEHIMRDLVNGSLLSYIHANGASFFFMCVYCHMLRGLFFASFKYSQSYMWMSGMLVFILMMGMAFMGYVLPWGQMSYWGATVMTNMISAMPSMGYSIVLWIWGGFSVAGPTLTRFFCFHFLFPFMLLALVLLHMIFLHQVGSSSMFYSSVKDHGDLATSYNLLSLSPHFILKDFVSLIFFFFMYLFVVFFSPDLLGHPDNYMEANALVTPEHIVPEWYFLPFYAILRSIPSKLGGVVFMFGALIAVMFLPLIWWFCEWQQMFPSKYKSNQKSSFSYVTSRLDYNLMLFRTRLLVMSFFCVVLLLGFIGMQAVEAPFLLSGQFLTFLYFFLVFSIVCHTWFLKVFLPNVKKRFKSRMVKIGSFFTQKSHRKV